MAESERAIILRGGPIFTIDGPIPVAEALAIRGREILAVGSATEVKRHYTPATEIVDLEGRAVLPGFVEPHLHVVQTALAAAGREGVPDASEQVAADAPARVALDASEPVAGPAPERLAELCARTLRRFAARGCTTVYDAGIGLAAGAAEHELLRSLALAPDAPVRVRGAFVPELARALGATPGGDDERYAVVGIAYRADGPLEDFAAALSEPYLDGRGTGRLDHDEAQLREAMRAWHRAGWQLLAHADGDRAIDQVLNIYEALLAEDPPPQPASPPSGRARLPHRIEHFTVAREDQIARAAALGVSVSHTIDDIYSRGARLRDEVLGAARAARIHALRSDAERGLCGSCHSDSPRSEVDPCLHLRTAVIRLLRDSDDVLGPAQQLDLAGALRTVTRNPAQQVGLGDRVGSLRPGMLADLVVLDRDPRAVDLERLHELRVLETWLGGRRQRWRDAHGIALRELPI